MKAATLRRWIESQININAEGRAIEEATTYDSIRADGVFFFFFSFFVFVCDWKAAPGNYCRITSVRFFGNVCLCINLPTTKCDVDIHFFFCVQIITFFFRRWRATWFKLINFSCFSFLLFLGSWNIPAPIENLHATFVTNSSVSLEWATTMTPIRNALPSFSPAPATAHQSSNSNASVSTMLSRSPHQPSAMATANGSENVTDGARIIDFLVQYGKLTEMMLNDTIIKMENVNMSHRWFWTNFTFSRG